MLLGNPLSKVRIASDSSHSPARRTKLTKGSLFFLKTMISDFFLSSGAFLNTTHVNKPAKNNKRMLIEAVFHFVDPVQNDS